MKKSQFFALITFLSVIGMVSLTIVPTNSWELIEIEPQISESLAEGDVPYLIITPSSYKSALEELALWKTQKGVTAEIKTIEEISQLYNEYDTAAEIKACIEEYYTTKNTQFVLLAGDHQTVPTRMAYIQEGYSYDGDYVGCDSYYANMNDWDSDGDGIYAEDNDDWNLTADVFVGRLSGNNFGEMQTLVDRIIMYESSPPVGDWMESALFAGSMTYFEADYYEPGDGISDYPEADGNRFFNYVYDQFYKNMTTTLLAEDAGIPAGRSDYPHNGSLTASSLWEGISNGTSILGILGHGNAPGIYRTIWDVDNDGDGLFDWDTEINSYAPEPDPDDDKHSENLIYAGYSGYTNPENMLSVSYLMGCSNGNFTTPGLDSLAEYMLKTVSIGSIGADRIVWGMDNWTEVEHGNFYSEGLAYRFFEQLVTFDQPGKAFALAKQDYCEDNATFGLPYFPAHPDWTQPKWSEKTVKHFNYFGDPELHIWMEIPDLLDAEWTEFNSSSTLIDVFKEGSIPVENVSVSLTDDDDNVYWIGTTNSSGKIIVPYDFNTVNDSVIVAYKPDFVPLLYEPYELPSPNSPILAEISPSVDRDGTIKLDWDDVEGAVSYNIYRETSSFTEVDGKSAIGQSTESKYTDRGLEDGIYYYIVTAIGEFGESEPSNCRFVTVDHRSISGFNITIISFAGIVTIVVVLGIVIPQLKPRK